MSDEFKYYCTMVDNFTKYNGLSHWRIKRQKIYWAKSKNILQFIMFLQTCRQIIEQNSKIVQ